MRRVRLAVAAVALAGFFALPVSQAARAQQPVPDVVLWLAEEADAGEEITVSAYLLDPAGNPIAGEVITFTAEVSFLNRTGHARIGRLVTSENGLATMGYEPRVEGEQRVTASFEGNQVFTPARASRTLTVLPSGQLYTEATPFRLPGANMWMVVAILLVVWSIYVFVMLLVWRTALRGRRLS